MIEVDMDYHRQRALIQAEQRRKDEREKMELKASPMNPSNSPDRSISSQTSANSASNRLLDYPLEDGRSGLIYTPRQRLIEAGTRIFTGISVGAAAGWCIGTVYALRKGHHQPIFTGLHMGIQLGMIGGQFVGFRDLLPVGLERFYWRCFASPSERQVPAEMSLWDMLNSGPHGGQEWTDRELDVIKSSLAGGTSGFLSNYAQGFFHVEFGLKSFSLSLSHSLLVFLSIQIPFLMFPFISIISLHCFLVKSLVWQEMHGKANARHAISAGGRGFIFWSIFFALGQIGWFQIQDWRQKRQVDEKLRRLYTQERYEELKAYLKAEQNPAPVNTTASNTTEDDSSDEKLPKRENVVGFTWKEFFSSPNDVLRASSWFRRLLDFMPMVHNKEGYDYRAYLDAKVRVLETDVNDLRQERSRLRKEIRQCRNEEALLSAAATNEVRQPSH